MKIITCIYFYARGREWRIDGKLPQEEYDRLVAEGEPALVEKILEIYPNETPTDCRLIKIGEVPDFSTPTDGQMPSRRQEYANETPHQLTCKELCQKLSDCPQNGRLIVALYNKNEKRLYICNEAITNCVLRDNQICFISAYPEESNVCTPASINFAKLKQIPDEKVVIDSKRYYTKPVIDILPFVDELYQYIAVVFL